MNIIACEVAKVLHRGGELVLKRGRTAVVSKANASVTDSNVLATPEVTLHVEN